MDVGAASEDHPRGDADDQEVGDQPLVAVVPLLQFGFVGGDLFSIVFGWACPGLWPGRAAGAYLPERAVIFRGSVRRTRRTAFGAPDAWASSKRSLRPALTIPHAYRTCSFPFSLGGDGFGRVSRSVIWLILPDAAHFHDP